MYKPLLDAAKQKKETTTMARINVPAADAMLDEVIPVLDKGFVRMIDYMGGDARIVQAARISYGAGTKTVNEDRGLINYLMRNDHGTPFEKVRFEYHVKAPLFIARQWMRHRMGSFNELSARYSVMKDDFYEPAPEQVRGQGSKNKQVGDVNLEHGIECAAALTFRNAPADCYADYVALTQDGVSREQARMLLPVSLYTEFYWTVDLRNLFGFLRLRLDLHAQKEIRDYAEALAVCARAVAPMAYEAFEEHVLGAVTISKSRLEALPQSVQDMVKGLVNS